MSSNFLLRNFPYSQPREIQAETIQLLEQNWEKYDVFVLQAPTAYGKSSIAKMLMNAFRSVSVITPTNLLVNQFREEFPDTPTLARLDSYHCEEWKRPCSTTRSRLMKFCKGCKCSGDLATAKYRRGPGIYNYHTYLSHKLYRDVLVVDEAHNLIPTIKDRLALKLWKHDLKYPHNMWKQEQLKEWLGTIPPEKIRKSKKLAALKESATYQVPEYVWQRTTDWFNGKGTLRNEPEERDLIKLLPVDITQAPPMFWPREVRKIVLLSATISSKDVEQLGLGGRRVCYLAAKSPIPAGSRPIVPLSLMSVNRTAMQDTECVAQLAKYIDTITRDHPGEKGVIHVTYSLSNQLRSYLSGPRYLFHNRDNKSNVYAEFRDSPADSGRVLIACGMYEGIDLPEDLGRWQIIAKVPWQSLGSPSVKHLADLDPEWYLWETMKTTIQACGRVCRTPTDYGTTFILDTSFWRLMKEGDKFIPQWFREAIVNYRETAKYLNSIGIKRTPKVSE